MCVLESLAGIPDGGLNKLPSPPQIVANARSHVIMYSRRGGGDL